MKTSVPVYNGDYYKTAEIGERYLYQISIEADQAAVDVLEQYATLSVAEVITKAAKEVGLARIKNVLDRWLAGIIQVNQDAYIDMPTPLALPEFLLAMPADGRMEWLNNAGQMINDLALVGLSEIEQKMEAELQALRKLLSVHDSEAVNIHDIAQQMGCCVGLIEYIQEWQGNGLEQWLDVGEIETIEYLALMETPLKEIYSRTCRKLSLADVGDVAIGTLMRQFKQMIIREQMMI